MASFDSLKTKPLLLIIISISVVAILGITVLHSYLGGRALSIMLILTALIAYFGVLIVPGGGKEGELFSESRIRLAITSSFVMVYFVYLSVVIFWKQDALPPVLALKMVETLTDLLTIVLPFYFGVTGAVEIFKDRSKSPPKKNEGNDRT